MRNAITGTRLVVLVTVLLLVSESALVQSEPAPETKSVSTWLKEWGEDVHYSVSYDREHEAYKALRELGPAAVAPLIQALGQSTGDSTQDWWTRDNAAFVLGDIGPAAKAGVPDLVTLLDAKNAVVSLVWREDMSRHNLKMNVSSAALPSVRSAMTPRHGGTKRNARSP